MFFFDTLITAYIVNIANEIIFLRKHFLQLLRLIQSHSKQIFHKFSSLKTVPALEESFCAVPQLFLNIFLNIAVNCSSKYPGSSTTIFYLLTVLMLK